MFVLRSYRITEYCGPALKEVIWKESYTVQDVKRWTRELLSAVRHLHEKGIIHRNLKPEAMCIHPKSKELTLIGFGAARGMDRSSQMTVAILPEPYTAIEIAMKWKEYDEKVLHFYRLSADEALAHPFLKVDKRKYRALEDKYETVMNPKERIVAKLSYAPVDEQQIKRAQMSQEQLPDFKSNDESKALRETQAMTDLNECDRIVRMHETWTEKPPEGWQYNVDLATLKTVEQNKFVSKMRETMTHRETFLYIRMELCKYSLRDWIDENTTVESRNLPRMKMWFHQVVTAVAFLQQKNFIHRDLKPCNILFFEDDNVKLCDLGIVTLRSKGGGPTAIYRTSIGTLLYMSPEQRSAAPKYGSKTDVFSLGLILAELSVVMTNDERNKRFDNYRNGIQFDHIADKETIEAKRSTTECVHNISYISHLTL
uniref:Protein kinase domain-containing protein n=1 Tax=Pristionchus pacificus TaxID=54126 RepID=A0A2A6CTE0_PRIPA|eukprot:PDM81494.1 protein kinase [Pristionchus pacificus]